MVDQTPMAKQYQAIKAQHQDAILFYRLGDFYEMFNEDALLAARELEITLTGRGSGAKRMPMCGVPHHAADNYIAKLINRGFKVAICEQVEDPKQSKGVVRRAVVKIITKGTTLDAKLLPSKRNNYLVGVAPYKNKFGLAKLEASTGEFKICDVDSLPKVLTELDRINPAELLFSDMLNNEAFVKFAKQKQIPATIYKDTYDLESAKSTILNFFKIKSINSFGLQTCLAGLAPAAKLIDYLTETQKVGLDHINAITPYRLTDFMLIDQPTRKNLELIETVRDKARPGSLLWVIDQTLTSMGSRLLLNFLLEPLLSVEVINQRLDGVAELVKDPIKREKLTKLLNNVFDIERLTGKIASLQANAKDLIALKISLEELPKFSMVLKDCSAHLIKDIADLPVLDDLVKLIQSAISDDPPFSLRDGGIIKKGYAPELDELLALSKGGKDWILSLEDQERRRTGIKSLKVGFNKVFGYYIDISKANLAKIPANYIRKQTLVNNERFITPELKEKEAFILNADERLKNLEYTIFCAVREKIKEKVKLLKIVAHKLALLDVLLSLASVAVNSNYVRPIVNNSDKIILKDSRHPVVEKMLGEHKFVKNDIQLNKATRFLLITGPNMAGKSTCMRQVALCCLLAQIGSFVPAAFAEIGVVDRIFTRIGAMDDIFAGQSTFMVEMTETANIIFNATENSLIILDEIGRGTSTFDGMSIAAAVAEYLHLKIKAKTLFATHYHEITQLVNKYPGMQNMNVAVNEKEDHITFLYKLINGAADQSYGIQVAKLAGFPAEIIARAKKIYGTLAMVENNLIKQKSGNHPSAKTITRKQSNNQMGLF